MKNYNKPVEINHNWNWSYIPDYPCLILIFVGLGSVKTNMLLNFIKQNSFFHKSKINLNQSISCLLMEEKK